MPTETHSIKLAICKEDEIWRLNSALNELEEIYKDLRREDLKDLDLSYLEYFSDFDQTDPESFLENILFQLSQIHHSRILFNCSTMLNNCADLTKDTLDFNPDIKKGLQLLQESKRKHKKGFSKRSIYPKNTKTLKS